MKSLISVMLILLSSWTAFGRDLTAARIPAMASSVESSAENQDTPAATTPAPQRTPQKVKKSHKGLWITVVVVAVVAVVAGSLAYTRFHNEGAI